MAWLTHSEVVERMTEHVNGLGWDPDLWWRDESPLLDWWDMCGHPSDSRTYMVAVPSGDCVAWIGRSADAHTGAALWTLYAYSLPLEIASGEYTEIATAPRTLGQGQKLDDRFVTQWSIGKPPPVPIRPAVTGDWCGCREDASGAGRLGQVLEIDARGRILTVQLDRHGTQGRASDYSRKWFALGNRHEACSARWATGQTAWKAYIAMLTALAREQKKALGLGNRAKLVRDDRPTTAPARTGGSGAPGYPAPITPPVGYKPPVTDPGMSDVTALYAEADRRRQAFADDVSLSDEEVMTAQAEVDEWAKAEKAKLQT